MNVPTPASPSSVPPVRKSRMHADDRHRQLLRSAIDCVARNGFAGTKTKDIGAPSTGEDDLPTDTSAMFFDAAGGTQHPRHAVPPRGVPGIDASRGP